MKKILFIAMATVVALSSCSKNEVDYNLESADNAISFGVYTGINTKAAETTSDSIKEDGFYVFGFYTDEATWAETITAIAPNFMYNQKVNYWDGSTSTVTGMTAAGWYYSPMKYWSEDYDDYYSFFAYAPEVATATGATLSLNTVTGVPSIAFDLTSGGVDLSKMVDFVTDVKIDEKSGKSSNTITGEIAETTTDVVFVLQHETSRVGITALTNITTDGTAKGETATHVIVKELEFTDASPFYTKATYTFVADENETGTWTSATAATSSYDMSGMLNKNNSQMGQTTVYAAEKGVDVVSGKTTPTDLLSTDFSHLFLIPASASTSTTAGNADAVSTATATLQVTYDIITVDSALAVGYALSENNVKTVTVPVGLFTQGVAYNLELTFYLNEVVLSATVDATWDSATEIDDSSDDENSTSGVDEV